MNSGLLFGPWVAGVDPAERKAQFRALAVLAAVFSGWRNPLIGALREAEQDAAAGARALELLDALPALTRRRMLSVFAAVHSPRGWDGRP
jgi:hypothetical protein